MEQLKFNMKLGKFTSVFNQAYDMMVNEKIIERIWNKDYTVWSNEPLEITNRLGWLHSPQTSLEALNEINEFVNNVLKDGFTKVLLMGMGGSSLAPEVFSLTFGSKTGIP